MKRKLALLLAAVMTVAAMPMNVFAASKNSITNAVNAEDETLIFEQGWVKNYSDDVDDSGQTSDDISYWIDGTNLKIVVDDTVSSTTKNSFKVKLENAKWFFRYNGTQTVYNGTVAAGYTEFVRDYTLEAADKTYTFEYKVPKSAFTQAVVAGSVADQGDKFRAELAAAELTKTDAVANAGNTAITGANLVAKIVTDTDSRWGADDGLTIAAANVVYKNGAAPTNKEQNYARITTFADATAAEDKAQANLDAAFTAIREAILDDNSKVANAAIAVTAVENADPATDKVTITIAVSLEDSVTAEAIYYRYSDEQTDVVDSKHVGWASGFAGNKFYQIGSEIGSGYAFDRAHTDYDEAEEKNFWLVEDNDSTFDPAIGYMDYDSGSRVYTYTRNAKAADDKYNTKENVNYVLEVVRSGDQTEAVITLPEGAAKDQIIVIPLVMLTTGEGDVRVKIDSQLSGVTSGNLLIGSTADGKTNTTVASCTTRRNDFTINRLRIQEQKIGSIYSTKAWTFEIRAPRGYYWDYTGIYDYNHSAASEAMGSRIGVYTEGDLRWADGSAGLLEHKYNHNKGEGKIVDSKLNTAGVAIDYKYKNGEMDDSILVVYVGANTFQKSVRTTGSLYLQNLKLVAEDDDAIPFGNDVYLTLKNVVDTIITEQDVKVGTATDYDISLTRVKDSIPELVSGRLEGYSTVHNGKYADYMDDDNHKAATVEFKEKVADAWWAQRNTVFTLPEEVRFMKVEFDEINNLGEGMEKELLKGSNDDGSGEYYNARKRLNKVNINDNTMTLTNLSIKNNEKASFEMEIWLSIQVDFEGEIDLVLLNSALKYAEHDDDIACTIATAIRPIEIDTTVTEAKIGYQYVSVADFDIKENVAGALLQNEQVWITVTDQISIDMAVAKGFGTEITEGNIKIKDITTGAVLGNTDIGGDAHISFKVQRESTQASVISFKDVQVKINRDVAYSNLSNQDERGIDIYVWGPAVAKNYYYLHANRTSSSNWFYDNNKYEYVNTNDLFNVAGISAKYINVATLATESNQAGFTNEVAVTMGSTTYTINGATAELEVAPYVSTASNSAMVPVRFISVALGLDESAVKWDSATSTVTIDANSRIVSFTTGSSYYMVNGTMIPMTSPDGLPVEMEIMNERSFVPFRALGEAFGIVVDWDSATSTATYNKATVQ